MSEITPPKAPLFRDPIYDGAADPTIIWNREEKTWWIVYTNRRANVDCRGVAWVHGTDIGIASSSDGGQNWVYRGILQGLEFERGRNTFWAPEIIWYEGTYHMFVSYVRGVPHDWSGERHIVHMTSDNLWDWHFQSILPLTSNRVIDACIHKLPNGLWRMWYKDEVNNSRTYAADSDDLFNWHPVGSVITDCAHEGPNVFYWHGVYWMVTDPWRGLGIYRSEDCESWSRGENILDIPGNRPDDCATGRHADVLVQGDNAYIFYFTHPDRNKDIKEEVKDVYPYAYRRSSLQVAKLELDRNKLICDRNKPFHFCLIPGDEFTEEII